ncbi:hypothetical protein VTI74DRAFT_7215 [Chaetomium olivicolor]
MPTRNLLMLDFDGTITAHDTLAALVSLCIAHQPAKATKTSPPEPDRSRLLSALWDEIVRDYVADHEAHVAAYTPRAEERTTLAQELTYLESLRAVEDKSVARVGMAGFFRGMDAARMRALGGVACVRGKGIVAKDGEDGDEGEVGGGVDDGGDGVDGKGKGGAVRLRKGFLPFIAEMTSHEEWDVAVVSVNWSGEFIRGVLEAGSQYGRRVKKVVANGIGLPDGLVKGPEELGGEPLVTAGDKLRAMRSLKVGMGEQSVVYFGDSTTDLACLVEADLGVVMADDGGSKLLRTFERVGLEVLHVGVAEEGSRLVWARDFEEVLESKVMERI